MIKQMRASYFHNFKNAQYCALSNDPIPDYLENGDQVYIIDQGKVYYWDESSSSLYEYKGNGEGGSGGSSSFIPCFGSLATVQLGTTWSGDDPYTSTVTVTGYTVTSQTMVSVLPSSDVIEQMLADGITNIFITNNDGVLTATAIGATPTVPMTLQVLCTESDIAGDIAELPSIVNDLKDSISDAYDATASYAVGDFCIYDNTLYRCNTAIPTGGEAWTPAHWDAVQITDFLGSGGAVTDVQINGTSILSDGVANVPIMGNDNLGLAKTGGGYGIGVTASGILRLIGASNSQIQNGINDQLAVKINQQHISAFYALAKAAGDTTQAQSSNPVGTYTDEAKSAIQTMLGISGGGEANCAPIIINTASGDIASFADGADNRQIRQIVGTIVPVQDLNGYDHPWPGGGGENKVLLDTDQATVYGLTIACANESITLTGTSNNPGYGYIALKNPVTLPAGEYKYGIYLSKRTNLTGFAIASASSLISPLVVSNSGFTTNTITLAEETTITRFRVSVETGLTADEVFSIFIGSTSATAWTPYSNECPISGWTGANIEQRGKNFRTIELSAMTEVMVSGSGSSSVSSILDDGVIIKNMNLTADYAYGTAMTTTITKSGDELSFTISNSGYGIGICVELPENKSFKVYSVSNSSHKYVQFYNANKEFISVTESNVTSFVTPAGTKYAVFTFRGVNNGTATVSEFCVYADNTASYESPKAGNTIPINWQSEAGTIYSGTVTLNEDGSADVVSDHILAIYNGNETWAIHLTDSFWITPQNWSQKRTDVATNYLPILNNSDSFGFFPGTNGRFYATKIIGNISGVTDLSSWKSYLSSHNLEVYYEITNPQSYHFDNVGQLYTFLGTNNVWIDTGAITECDYPADTKLYIDGKIAEMQATILENIGG